MTTVQWIARRQVAAMRRAGRRDSPVEGLDLGLGTPLAWLSHVAATDPTAGAQVLARLQRQVGNRRVAAELTSLQRCGGDVHDGCPCAVSSEDEDAAPGSGAAVVQRRTGPDVPPRSEHRASEPTPDPWAGPAEGPTGIRPAPTAPTGGRRARLSEHTDRQVTAELVSEAEFSELTGLPPDALPEGLPVRDVRALASAVRNAPGDLLPPGVRDAPARQTVNPAVAGAAIAAPSPVSYVPANSTGIMWVQGHLSIFASVDGKLTVRGFRGNLAYYTGEMLPGRAGDWFSKKLNLGVPGGFVNDMVFTKMPGQQTVIYVPVDPDTAAAFRDELNSTRYTEAYKYSAPRAGTKPGGKEWRMRQFLLARGGEAMAVQCGVNCITLPLSQIETATGTRPQVDTPGGRLDITTGRTAGGPVDPHEKGRASRLREYMAQPDLSGAKPGAGRIGMTEGAVKALGVVRIGGGIWLLYGGVDSVGRLVDAWRTDQFGRALATEGAAWTGGIMGAHLGSSLAAGIGELIVIRGGTVTASYVFGGFGLALAAGYLGAQGATMLVNAIIDAPQVMVWGVTSFLEGFLDANVAMGGAVHGTLVDALLRPLVVTREQIDPGNWALRGLPAPAAAAVRNLGLGAWSMLGPLSPDELRGSVGLTFSQLGVAPALAADASRALVPAGILITGADILGRTPLDLVRYLQRAGALTYVRDPDVVADEAVHPDGHRTDEADLQVRLAPLVAERARINPGNWDLRAVHPGAGAGDIRSVGQRYWRQLQALDRAAFAPAAGRSLADFGITEEAARAAARAMLRSTAVGGQHVAGETVPAEIVNEYARELLSCTPADFVRQLEGHGLRFHADPGALAGAARHWIRAGYQPW